MTRRILSQTGLGADVSLSPPRGYVWRLQHVLAVLTASATAGTRGTRIHISISNSGIGPLIAQNSTGSTVSQKYGSYGGPGVANIDGVQTNANTQWGSQVEMGEDDVLQTASTFIAGDTLAYYFVVEELPA